MDFGGLDPALLQQAASMLQAAGGGGLPPPPPPPGPPPMDGGYGGGGGDRRDRRGGGGDRRGGGRRGGGGGRRDASGLDMAMEFGGVCKAYTQLRCGYGSACKYSHDAEKIRAAVNAGLVQPVPEFRIGEDNEQIFGGRPRELQDRMGGDDRGGRGRGRDLDYGEEDALPVRNMRVKDFPPHWGQQDLTRYFQQFGDLDDCGVLVPKKLAYVKFKELAVAQQVHDTIKTLPPAEGNWRMHLWYHSNLARKERERELDMDRDRRDGRMGMGDRDRRDDRSRDMMGGFRGLQQPSPMDALAPPAQPSQAEAIAQLMKSFGGSQGDATGILASLGLGGAPPRPPQKNASKVYIFVRAPHHKQLSESVQLNAYPMDLTAVETLGAYATTHENVYVVFSVNGLDEFAGYAKLTSLVPPGHPSLSHLPGTFPPCERVATLMWQSVGSVPFADIGGDPALGTHCKELAVGDGAKACAQIDACYKSQHIPATVNDIDVTNLEYEDYLRLVSKQVAEAASRN